MNQPKVSVFYTGTFSVFRCFLFHGMCSHEIKTLCEDRTAAQWKMPIMRPAAGGESSKAGFLLTFDINDRQEGKNGLQS